MGSRFSKIREDGTVAHYDTEEEMQAADPNPGLLDFSWISAFCGVAAGLFFAVVLLYGLKWGAAWPKWGRATLLVAAGLTGGYVVGRTGRLIFLGLLVLGAATGLWLAVRGVWAIL